jgi:hypothetical protein
MALWLEYELGERDHILDLEEEIARWNLEHGLDTRYLLPATPQHPARTALPALDRVYSYSLKYCGYVDCLRQGGQDCVVPEPE